MLTLHVKFLRNMKFFRNIPKGVAATAATLLTAAAILLGTAALQAQSLSQLPTMRINGQEMYYYDVRPGDNLYTIASRLGVSTQEIKQYNPSVAEGVKPRMRLFFAMPAQAAQVQGQASDAAVSHVVQKGESVYGIARKYGTTVDALMALNPKAADGIRPGDRIRLPGDNTAPATHPDTSPAPVRMEKAEIDDVAQAEKAAETAAAQAREEAQAAVAEAQAATAAARTAANNATAAVESLPRAPRTIATSATAEESTPTSTDILAVADSIAGINIERTEVQVDSVALAEIAEHNNELRLQKGASIVVMLPFLLNEEHIGRQTQLYTEFYKGFLLAADTLNREGRTPVKITTFDTAANIDTVRSIMARPEVTAADLFIAPDNPEHIKLIAAAAPEDALILNVFAVRDDAYQTTPSLIQLNIPHDPMYEHAISGFMEAYPQAQTIFLQRINGKADKDEFATELKKRLTQEGRDFRTITYDGNLKDEDLADLDVDAYSYVFVPLSGNRDEFTRIVPALKALKEKALVSPEAVQLFGYPEYATFRGAQFDDICDLETTIYSRYFPTENDTDARALNDAFRNNFGEGLSENQMPVLGILGYDIGTLAIEGLRTEAREGEFPGEFTGIQSGVRLARVPDGGWFNNALFMIHYRPGGVISRSLR